MTNARSVDSGASVALMAGLLALSPGFGCSGQDTGIIVILENQTPQPSSASSGSTGTSTYMSCTLDDVVGNPRIQGTLDVALDKAYPYIVFPLLQNLLSSLVVNGVERNNVSVSSIRVHLQPPAGLNLTFPSNCPATFDEPASASLAPAALQEFTVSGMQTCHTQIIRDAVMAGQIPANGSQPVFFTIGLTVEATHQGDSIQSAEFPFQVQICAGCLQVDFPQTPLCSATPKPNPYKGNGCTPGQDDPGLLCCFDSQKNLVCPAPDF